MYDLTDAITKEKAVFEIIAPKVGGVTAADGSWIKAHRMIDGGPSVLFEAVVLLSSHQAVENLVKEATARDFVAEAFHYCKFMDYDRAGVAAALNEGSVQLSDNGAIAILSRNLVGSVSGVAGKAWKGLTIV